MRGWTEEQLDIVACIVSTCLRHTRREYVFPIIVELVSHLGLPAKEGKRIYHELTDAPIPDADEVMSEAESEHSKIMRQAPCVHAEFKRRTVTGSDWLCCNAAAKTYGQTVGASYCARCDYKLEQRG